MRVALIADIHGNLAALDVVLGELERERLDAVICLGDVAALGPQPRECVARLREIGCPSVMGNTDEWLIDARVFADAAPSAPVAALTLWAKGRLTMEDLDAVRSYPRTIERALDEAGTLLCFHGSPHSNEDVIAAVTPEPDLDAMLDDDAAVLAGGHTHIPLLRRVERGLIVNPGSVGLAGTGPGTPDLPVNRDVAWTEYALLGITDGRWSVEFRRAPLDVERMLALMRASGMPYGDWWAGLWAAG